MAKPPIWILAGALALCAFLTACRPQPDRLIEEKVVKSALLQTPKCPILWRGAVHKEAMDTHAEGLLGEVWEADFEWNSFHVTMNWLVIYQGSQILAMKPLGNQGECPFRLVAGE